MTDGARGLPVHPNLNPRSESVLKTLIEAYLVEGEPVGSRLLSRRYPEAVSPATLRNVMADLEEEHLLAQPHTSAGRIPTELAYRWYVNRWVRPEPPHPELGAKLEEALEGAEQDPDLWLRHASRVLSEVMGGICVALPVRLVGSRLVRLEFVPLGTDRLVALWVGSGGDVEHQVMSNPWGISPRRISWASPSNRCGGPSCKPSAPRKERPGTFASDSPRSRKPCGNPIRPRSRP